MFNPFEQFEIIPLIRTIIGSYDMSVTNLTMVLVSTSLLLIILLFIIDKSITFIPNNFQLVLELSYQFISTIVLEQAGKKGLKYFPHLFTIFSLILFFNLSGLTPFSFTASSHIIITFSLSLSYFLAWILIALKELHFKVIYIFFIKNMPNWLTPLLTTIEVLSFFLRPISLGVRLFANMLAGHILLHILAGATYYLMSKVILLFIPAFTIISAIGLLEIGIGFLQAYIFVILLAIYLKDSLYAHS